MDRIDNLYRKLRIFYKRLTGREKTTIFFVSFLFFIVFLKAIHDVRTYRIIKKEEIEKAFKFKKVIVLYREINRYTDIVPINCSAVVPVTYTKVISLRGLPIPERKKKFIDMVLPSILIVNFYIEQDRNFIKYIKNKIKNGKFLLPEEEEKVKELLERYKAETLNELLEKMNVNPVSIVLAQAAIESGWGTSRFFVEANNIFGVWTFNKKYASKIKARKSNVYLKAYPSLLNSVKDYYYSINMSWAYKKFRLIRLRTDDPFLLSNYLEKYSILRERYVEKIKIVIKTNNLTKYDNCRLSPAYIH